MNDFEKFLEKAGITPDDKRHTAVQPFVDFIAHLHHGLIDRGVPISTVHVYVTEWIRTSIEGANDD